MTTWIQSKPSEPGFYWVRYFCEPIKEKMETLGMIHPTEGGLWVYWVGTSEAVFLDDFDSEAEWCGPIEPPR
jgi:hypothetical protein